MPTKGAEKRYKLGAAASMERESGNADLKLMTVSRCFNMWNRSRSCRTIISIALISKKSILHANTCSACSSRRKRACDHMIT